MSLLRRKAQASVSEHDRLQKEKVINEQLRQEARLVLLEKQYSVVAAHAAERRV